MGPRMEIESCWGPTQYNYRKEKKGPNVGFNLMDVEVHGSQRHPLIEEVIDVENVNTGLAAGERSS